MNHAQTTQQIISQSGIAFGTSGARGLVEQFTPQACAAFTTAFIYTLRQHQPIHQLAIGIDRRPSSPNIAAACTAAAQATGVTVIDYGILPTPALALQAQHDRIPALMITGSHIPFDRNGIKFYRPEGEISKADEQAILNASAPLPPRAPHLEQPAQSERAQAGYLARYTQWFTGKPLTGWRVGFYQHSAAGRELTLQILQALGAHTIPLGRSETFVPIDTEAVTEQDRTQGPQWCKEHRLNALLTTDGDGDRPLLADENGHWLRGDLLGLLCARELGIDALAVPINCNTAIEQSGAFRQIIRTRIGSPHVLAAMQQLLGQHQRVAGFEANGGFMLASTLHSQQRHLQPLPTRDALLPALTLMVSAARQNKPLSGLVNALPPRHTASDRLANIPNENSRPLLSGWREDPAAMQQALTLPQPITALDDTDGLRAHLANGDIIHLRPSGNAPELRCYAEASTPARAQQLTTHCLHAIATILGCEGGGG